MNHEELRAIIEIPVSGKFWGMDYTITPLLIDTVFGDGKKLFWIMPLMSRPNYYVIRVDSIAETDDIVCDNEENTIQAIEEMFCNADDNDEGEARLDWPAWHDGGYCYGFMKSQPLMADALQSQPQQVTK